MVDNNNGYEVINEGMRGTLEQLSMSPLGIWRIMTARLIARTLLNFIMVSGLLYAAMLTTGQWFTIALFTIPPILVLTLFSMFGLGLMVAGIVLIVEQLKVSVS